MNTKIDLVAAVTTTGKEELIRIARALNEQQPVWCYEIRKKSDNTPVLTAHTREEADKYLTREDLTITPIYRNFVTAEPYRYMVCRRDDGIDLLWLCNKEEAEKYVNELFFVEPIYKLEESNE